MTIQQENSNTNTTLVKAVLENGTVVYMTLCTRFITLESNIPSDFGLNELFSNAKTMNRFDSNFPKNILDFGAVSIQATRVTWGLLDSIEQGTLTKIKTA